ncbi:hypothetical protein, partial [Rhodoplanes elegans]|uniref:hypothetical protein n=1 Tax=Rhodoplanes elegans TaxID=29408 RepID=UPI001AECA5F2
MARVVIGLVLLITSLTAVAVTITLAQGAPAAAWVVAGLGVVTVAALVAGAAALSAPSARPG